jgi:hypothetical protein
VGLVENEDFVSVTGRCKDCTLAKVARIVNTVVRGRVNFNNV